MKYNVDNAIILAAGFGSRFVPLTYETPKGLLKVKGQVMLERQIEQLIEVGIKEIILVVGYMKEKFDYLVDKYNVKLVYNKEYSTKNNLATLYHARQYLKSSYILCADNYLENNIFNAAEPHSWFCCPFIQGETAEWCVAKESRKGRIKKIKIGGKDSFVILGPAFFSKDFSQKFVVMLEEYYNRKGTENFYWEHILKENIKKLPIYINNQTGNIFEFECLEELRQYDKSYLNQTNSKIMQEISKVFDVPESKINNIYPLKEGVTNDSFLFAVNGTNYVYRLPGKGTDKLINRKNEHLVYSLLKEYDITDEVIYFDAESGVKISKYYEQSRVVDPNNDEDLQKAMKMIAILHQKAYKIDHRYDIKNMINYYKTLAQQIDAIHFSDFEQTNDKMNHLIDMLDKMNIEEIVCHGDYAHTNVLILKNGETKLIDFEYSGAGDPIMDISMFCIYAYFDRERIDKAMQYYLQREPTKSEKARLYAYVALGGHLWSLWGEYKQGMGQEFGEYPLIMYRYAKNFYDIIVKEGLLNE